MLILHVLHSTQQDTGLSPDNLWNEPLWIPVLTHRSLAHPSLGVSELIVEFSWDFAVVVTIHNVSWWGSSSLLIFINPWFKTRHNFQLARRLKLVTSVYLVTSYSTDISLLVPSRLTVPHDRDLSVLLTLLRPPSLRASSSHYELCPGLFRSFIITARKYK